MMRYRNGGPCGPGPVCYTQPPAVYGSGRLYQPWALAAQLPGQAYMFGATDAGVPIAQVSMACPTGSPAAWFPGRNPDPMGGDVVGAGIFQPKVPLYWDRPTLGPDHGRWAVPGYIAREPDQGWWVSEAKDEFSGARAWITNMVSGLGGLGFVGDGGAEAFRRSVANANMAALTHLGTWASLRRAYPSAYAGSPAEYRIRIYSAVGSASRSALALGLDLGGRFLYWEWQGRDAPTAPWRVVASQSTATRWGAVASGWGADAILADLYRVSRIGRPATETASWTRERAAAGLGLFETTGSKVVVVAGLAAAAVGLWYFLRQQKKAKAKAKARSANRRRNRYFVETYGSGLVPHASESEARSSAMRHAPKRGGWSRIWHEGEPGQHMKLAGQYGTTRKGLVRRLNSGEANEVRLTPSGWTARWRGDRPAIIYLDYEGKEFIRSQSVQRYSQGRYGFDWPEVVPEAVKKKLKSLFERLHRS